MDEWSILLYAVSSLSGGLIYLRIVAGAIGGTEAHLRQLERRLARKQHDPPACPRDAAFSVIERAGS